jgi:phenylalanyl-tRNA synthetase beta chain
MPLPSDWTPGTDIRQAMHLSDTFIELKLTPNRADCLSILGVAREVAALTGAPLTTPPVKKAEVTSSAKTGIVMDAPKACPRFAARVIENVNPNAETPLYIKERLRSAGVRSISALVDITNYVMLETGQPMHAYDCARLTGDIVVRFARQDETLLLLNEQTLALTPDALLICDTQKPLGLAGIMGGEYSGIAANTTRVLLEAAFFAPDVIIGKMRRFGFVSDAGHRFERGVDFSLPPLAIERATELILDICGGHAGALVDEVKTLPERPAVGVRLSRVSKLLGWAFTRDQVKTVFDRLHFAYEIKPRANDDEFLVTPPSFRFDLTLEEDFVEEIARVSGYQNIPLPTQTHGQKMLALPENALPADGVRSRLAHLGWQEIVTFSFVGSETEKKIHGDNFIAPVALQNPIAAHLDVMRVSLVSGLLDTLKTNLNRKEPYLRLFEVGRVFWQKDANPDHQPYRLGGLAYGAAAPEQWAMASRPVDFYDIKGALEALVFPRKLTTTALPQVPPYLHPRQSAMVAIDNLPAGVLGALHPKLSLELGLPMSPIVFELDWRVVVGTTVPTAHPISTQPMARRDLAIIVNRDIPAQSLIDTILDVRPKEIETIEIFDVYQGKNIPDDKKSVAILMLMRDTERTLTESDIDRVVQTCFDALKAKFGATLRT